MAGFNLPNVDGLTSLEQVKNAVGIMVKELSWLLQNLDTRNVNELNAEVIVAGSVSADKIQAKAITADKIDVDKLSAISANMGKLTSGEIFSAYIATRENAYPRVELSNTSNMLGAYKSPSNSIQIYSPVEKFSPVIKFEVNGVLCYIFYNPEDNTFSMTSNSANVNLSTQRRIQLFAQEGVYVTGWSSLKNNGTGRSMEDELQDIYRRLKILEGH